MGYQGKGDKNGGSNTPNLLFLMASELSVFFFFLHCLCKEVKQAVRISVGLVLSNLKKYNHICRYTNGFYARNAIGRIGKKKLVLWNIFYIKKSSVVIVVDFRKEEEGEKAATSSGKKNE